MTCDRLERDDLLGRFGERIDAHVHECADCRARYGEYARLIAALSQESTRPLPAGWKERTLARLRAERMARRRRLAMVSGLAASAAAAVLLLVICRTGESPTGPSLVVRVEQGEQTWRGAAHPGNRLRVSASAGSIERFELRIYLEARELLVRCPSSAPPTCRVLEGAVEATLPLASRGEYQVIWLVSSSPLPVPTGNLDADVRAAGRAGARIAGSDSINVY